jgi:hypothetical protein
MHVVVSWDISASEPDWSAINERLLGVFKPYNWIRPLNTFYVVKVNSEEQRALLHNELLTAARSTPITVLFLVSPIIHDGKYQGLLPKDTWPDLNAKTQ